MSTDPNIQVCMLAGHNKRGPEVLAYVEKMQPGHKVVLVRDPTNKWDKNAVQVHAEREGHEEGVLFIGFIAKAHNRRIAALMDEQNMSTGYALDTVFGYAGTGKSKVPAIKITFPEEIAS